MRARGAISLLVATVLAVALAPAASAAIPVTTITDEADGECAGDCSLRDAVLISSRNGDIVTVPPGTYRLVLGELVLLGAKIQGTSGAAVTVIDGNNASRVLRVQSGINQVSGVTVTRGTGLGGQFPGSGGGILVQNGATLTLSNSAVVGNSIQGTATAGQSGGGIAAGGALTVTGSTIAGNRANGQFDDGAGLSIQNQITATLTNTTVSGNTAVGNGGGVYILTGTLRTQNATIARNQAFNGGGIYNSDGIAILTNTIVADSLQGGACGNGIDPASHHNLDDDNTCGLSIPNGDKPNTDPMLGLLANNGGQTATHALSALSPAINAGDSLTCPATDQRGAARPAGACDMGAFEYVRPTLRVITSVINNNGGSRTAAGINVHVRAGGADVAGSPAPGTSAGRSYTLAAGTYTVSADAVPGYVLAVGGSCGGGAVALAENQVKTCTVTANDVAVGPPPLPPPVAGKTVNARPKSGRVRVKVRGSKKFVRLTEGMQVPVGTIFDTRKGHVTLEAANDKQGGLATGEFWAASSGSGRRRAGNRSPASSSPRS